MAERSEEEVITGLLQISVGGIVKPMPTLKAAHVGAWLKLVYPPEGADPKPIGEWAMEDTGKFNTRTIDIMLDLIVAYDTTAALGGREWLGGNADPQQLRVALEQMLANAHPLAENPAGLMLPIVRAAARSVLPSSTNGSSPNGDSTQEPSALVSIPSR